MLFTQTAVCITLFDGRVMNMMNYDNTGNKSRDSGPHNRKYDYFMNLFKPNGAKDIQSSEKLKSRIYFIVESQ